LYQYSIEIFSRCAEQLAVPQMRWLGVHPSDLNELNENLMKELSKVLQFISTFID
jgi:predicted urease superfamily metal-dependent hydrolase